jgi:hypothetical protein
MTLVEKKSKVDCQMINSYLLTGIILVVAGLSLAALSYFGKFPLYFVSMGIIVTILGITWVSLAYRTAHSLNGLRTSKIFILTLTFGIILVNILLSLWGHQGIANSFIVSAVIYLIATLFYSVFNPPIRSAFGWINLVIFLISLVILVNKALETLR